MKRVILLLVLILLISSGYSFAAVPCKINYQGRLIKDNVPVDGQVNMEFKLYTQLTGGTPIKTISLSSVPVYNGLFRVVLDLASGIDWAAGQTIYLEVKVGNDILTPREELSAYPYAINSHLLEGKAKDYFINTSTDTQKKDGGLNIMGNVGIGTTSPGEKLTVSRPGAGQILRLEGGAVDWSKFNFGSSASLGLTIGSDQSSEIFSIHGMAPTGSFLILPTGNVGIGTTSPGEKLTVTGTIESTTGGIKFPDGTLQTTAAEGGVFGSWTNRDSVNNTLVKDATYNATSDGFVSVYVTAFTVEVYGYTDSSNPPTTLRFIASAAHAATGNPKGSFTMPVRKGDYWKVTTNTGSPDSIQWLPIGSGACVKQ
jgi:hypothetical protein